MLFIKIKTYVLHYYLRFKTLNLFNYFIALIYLFSGRVKLLTTQTKNCCFCYLVTGSSIQDLSLPFYRGKSTISYIVYSTCAAMSYGIYLTV